MKGYFIESKQHENHYLHFSHLDTNGDAVYKLLKGTIGAAVWENRIKANLFITLTGLIGQVKLVSTKIVNQEQQNNQLP